jgi:hypothetical protein
MSINQDFSDLFAELNAAGARYLLVGGYAIAVHAEPRFTKDLDVWIDPAGDNPSRAARSASVAVVGAAAVGSAVAAGAAAVVVDDLT